MIRFLVRRVAQLVLTALVLVLATFVVLRLTPGGPAQALLGADRYTPALEAALNERLGLDRSIGEQLGRWGLAVLRGDLGDSYFFRRPAVDVVRERLLATLVLGGVAFAAAVVAGIPLGVWAAACGGSRLDRVLSRVAVTLVSVPSFWLGIGLILVFSAWLGWLPSSGLAPAGRAGTWAERTQHLILPLLTTMASHVGILALYTRAAVAETLAADFTRTARTIGASEWRVVWRHALPPAAVPIVTMAGLTLAHFLEGSLVVETIFAWPGIGQLTVASVAHRDYPVLLALTLCAGVAVVLATSLADLAAAWLDPRVPRS